MRTEQEIKEMEVTISGLRDELACSTERDNQKTQLIALLEGALDAILRQFPTGYDCRITELAGGALATLETHRQARQERCVGCKSGGTAKGFSCVCGYDVQQSQKDTSVSEPKTDTSTPTYQSGQHAQSGVQVKTCAPCELNDCGTHPSGRYDCMECGHPEVWHRRETAGENGPCEAPPVCDCEEFKPDTKYEKAVAAATPKSAEKNSQLMRKLDCGCTVFGGEVQCAHGTKWRLVPEPTQPANDKTHILRMLKELAVESIAAYERLREMATKAGDTQGALAHLCERDAVIGFMGDIERRLSEPTRQETSGGSDEQP